MFNSKIKPRFPQYVSPFILAITFSLLLLTYEEWYFTGRYIQFLRNITVQGTAISLAQSYTLLMLLFCAQVGASWAVFVARPWWKFPFSLLFIYSAFAQAGYWNAFYRFITVQDVLTAYYSSAGLWRDAIGMFFSWYALIPTLLFLFFLWLTWDGQEGGRVVALTTAVLLTLFATLSWAGYRTIPASANIRFLHTMAETGWSGLSAPQQFERPTLTYQAPTPPTTNIILIIDESIRGDHLSINGYERPTTPTLDQLAQHGFLYNWGIAAASATCSLQTNHVMLNGVPRLPDTDYRVYQNPTIYQYAKAMGYRTYHIDAQADYLWNGITLSDLAYVDERITPRTLGSGVDTDLQAAELIHNIIHTSTGNFIVLNKKGVHFPYFRAYPPEATVWTPIVDNLEYNNYPLLTNTYDNGILYTVDGFFHKLIPDPEQMAATILYTADHGQTLSQNGEHWAHCRGSRNETIVPLFILSPHPLAVDTTYLASHFNIYTTLLDLIDAPLAVRHNDLPLSLLQATAADSAPRFYLPADRDFFTGEPVLFDP